MAEVIRLTVSCVSRLPPSLKAKLPTMTEDACRQTGAHARALISGCGFDAPRNLLSRR
ncbi:hypothetical protein EMIT0158MI4_90294 [Burkholderia ambifaria]